MRDATKVHGILRISAIVLVFCVDFSLSLPTEQPTKFSLNTGGVGATTNADSKTTSTFKQGRVSDLPNFVYLNLKQKVFDQIYLTASIIHTRTSIIRFNSATKGSDRRHDK